MTKTGLAGCATTALIVLSLIAVMSGQRRSEAQDAAVPRFDGFYPVYEDFVGNTLLVVIRHKTQNVCMVQSMRPVGGHFDPGGLAVVPMEVCTDWTRTSSLPLLEK